MKSSNKKKVKMDGKAKKKEEEIIKNEAKKMDTKFKEETVIIPPMEGKEGNIKKEQELDDNGADEPTKIDHKINFKGKTDEAGSKSKKITSKTKGTSSEENSKTEEMKSNEEWKSSSSSSR